jgi:hypothetical protein
MLGGFGASAIPIERLMFRLKSDRTGSIIEPAIRCGRAAAVDVMSENRCHGSNMATVRVSRLLSGPTVATWNGEIRRLWRRCNRWRRWGAAL